MAIPDNIRSAVAGHLAHRKPEGLLAATAHWNDAAQHLRIDFHFGGTMEDVDLEELEPEIIAEIIASIWSAVETVGFALFFDALAREQALSSPSLVYPATTP